MLNLEKCQAIYQGNIANVVHTSDLANGNIVGLGAVSADFDGGEVYEAVVPATADLGTKEYLMVFQDEYTYKEGDTISDFVVPANKPFKAVHLTVGDEILISDSDVTGTPTEQQFLVPADGDTQLNAAIDLTGGTRLALEVVETGLTIGYDKDSATRARVISV